MATTPTNKPIPSEDPRDLKFNAGKIDEEVNGSADYYTDRFSVQRLTNTGRNNQFQTAQTQRESDFQQFLLNSGYQFLGDYENGPYTITARNQIIRYQNEFWRLNADTNPPYTTTGVNSTSWATDVTHFVSVGDANLRQELASISGEILVGSPATINDLKNIYPLNYARVETRGAFAEGDGGEGSWVFDHSNLSAEVTNYPRVFIAPNADPSGASGAWRPNIAKKSMLLASIGFGILGLDASAGATWPLQAANAAQVNKEILEQFAAWDAGQRKKIMPPSVIYSSSYSFPLYDPKLEGTPSVGSANGTFILTHEDLSTNPVIDIGQLASRMSGLYLRDIPMASYKFFSTPSYNTFTDARDNRIGWRIRHAGTQVKVSGLYAAGFSRGFYLSETWDGSYRDCRALYCSTPTGSVPAVFIGTAESDNSNNTLLDHFHVEFSPYALEVGFCEHVTFSECKFETYRQANATHNVIRVQPEATKVNFNSCMIVSNNASTTHVVQDAGQFPKWNQCWFAGADDAGYPQAGIHWYRRVSPTNSQAEINGCHFNRCHAADGSDPLDYTIILNNYTKFSGQVRVSPSYNTSGGTVTTVNTGLLNIGTSCFVEALHLIVGSAAKSAGAVLNFTGTGSAVGKVTQTAGDSIYKLVSGDPNNTLDKYGSGYQNTTSSVIDVYGRRVIFLTAATSVTQFNGLVGDDITIISNVSGSTLVYNASLLVTNTGASISMVAGRPYRFTMVGASKAAQA